VINHQENNLVLDIYDILGRKIKRLLPYAGANNELLFRWDGLNRDGKDCPSGTYFYMVSDDAGKTVGRMTYIK
jgi:flagellar hook assembly protein FlgD